MMNRSRIDKINQVLANYFEKNKSVKCIPAQDMMDYFVNAGIFKADSERHGLAIRKVLRELDENNQLDMIPYVVVERKDRNRFWYFKPINYR